MNLIERKIDLVIFVYQEIEYFPLTGIYSKEEEIKSAITNRVKFTSNRDIRQQIVTSVGGFNYNLIEGTSDKHWDGGVVSECNFDNVKFIKDSIYPIINTGTYTLFDKSKKLYSDESYVKVLEYNSSNLISEEIKIETIEVSIFKRDSNFNNIKFLEFYDDPTADYAYEYNLETNRISFNKLYNLIGKYVPDGILSADFITKFGEYKFFGNGTKRLIYSDYFPLNKEYNRLFSINKYNKEIRIWQRVNNFLNHAPDQLDCYYVVPEKGLIVTSGTSVDQTKEFYIKESFYDSNSNLISLIVFENISDWDSQGLININDSIYSYNEKKIIV